MCSAIALPPADLPDDVLALPPLRHRVYERDGAAELRFYFRDREPLLPVRHEGQLRFVRWGVKREESRKLPPTGWTWKETVEKGGWSELRAELVEVPAAWGWERGIWFRVEKGLQGLLVKDERGRPAVHVVCEATSNYYAVMKARHQPVLLGQRL